MENRKENKRQLVRKRQKTNQINTTFVAAVNAEDNVTQLLSDPDDDNSNLICVAEYALALENILSESVEQNEPCKSTGATNPKKYRRYITLLPHSFYDSFPSDPDKWPDLYLR